MWNTGKKQKEKTVEKGMESSSWDKTRKVKIRKSLFCLETEQDEPKEEGKERKKSEGQ